MFHTTFTQSNDMSKEEMLKINESIRPIINYWIKAINESDKVHNDMVNVIESKSLYMQPPKINIFEEEALNNKYRYQIYDNNKNKNVGNYLIPNDLLAYKLSKDKRIKSIKEIKAISYDNDSNIYIEFGDKLPSDYTFVVNEAYIGKTPNLLSIEEKFRELRRTITPKQYSTFDSLPLVEEINTLFKAQFGMDLFSLHLEPDPIPNAWTVPVGYKFDVVIDKTIRKYGIGATSRDGFRFKPNNGIAIIASITSGLLFRQDVSAEEIVAILIHEIGHNFQDYIDGKLHKYDSNYILNIYDYYMVQATTNALYAEKAEVQKEMSNSEDYENIISPKSDSRKQKEYNQKKSSYNRGYVFYAFSRLLNAFTLGIPSAILSILFIPVAKLNGNKSGKEFMNRTAEMVADKFATVYGYGGDLANGLTKITNDSTRIDAAINRIPLLGALLTIERIPEELLINMIDEHPALVSRIDDQIFTIEEELKKTNMSSECRKALETDLAQLQKCRKDIISSEKSVLTIKGAQGYLNRYIDGLVDKKSREKVSKRLNEEMDALIKKS